MHFGIPFCNTSPHLGLFVYSQKKYNPSQILEDGGLSSFSISKVSPKSKNKNLK
jgi:hypothetical protein